MKFFSHRFNQSVKEALLRTSRRGLYERFAALSPVGGHQHTPQYIQAVLEAAAGAGVDAEVDPDAPEDVQTFAKHFLDAPSAFSTTPAGVAAVKFEAWMISNEAQAFKQLVEVIVGEKDPEFVAVFQGKVQETDWNALKTGVQDFVTLERVVNAGDRSSEDYERSDVTLIKGTPVEGQDKASDTMSLLTRPKDNYDATFAQGWYEPRESIREGVRIVRQNNRYGKGAYTYRTSDPDEPVAVLDMDEIVHNEPKSKMDDNKSKVRQLTRAVMQGEKIEPIHVRQVQHLSGKANLKFKYQVLDGHHRYWAHKMAGKKHIRAIVVPPSDLWHPRDVLPKEANRGWDRATEKMSTEKMSEETLSALVKLRAGRAMTAAELQETADDLCGSGLAVCAGGKLVLTDAGRDLLENLDAGTEQEREIVRSVRERSILDYPEYFAARGLGRMRYKGMEETENGLRFFWENEQGESLSMTVVHADGKVEIMESRQVRVTVNKDKAHLLQSELPNPHEVEKYFAHKDPNLMTLAFKVHKASDYDKVKSALSRHGAELFSGSLEHEPKVDKRPFPETGISDTTREGHAFSITPHKEGYVLRAPSETGYMTRPGRIGDVLGRWSHNRGGYSLSRTAARRALRLIDHGWDGNRFSGSVEPPETHVSESLLGENEVIATDKAGGKEWEFAVIPSVLPSDGSPAHQIGMREKGSTREFEPALYGHYPTHKAAIEGMKRRHGNWENTEPIHPELKAHKAALEQQGREAEAREQQAAKERESQHTAREDRRQKIDTELKAAKFKRITTPQGQSGPAIRGAAVVPTGNVRYGPKYQVVHAHSGAKMFDAETQSHGKLLAHRISSHVNLDRPLEQIKQDKDDAKAGRAALKLIEDPYADLSESAITYRVESVWVGNPRPALIATAEGALDEITRPNVCFPSKELAQAREDKPYIQNEATMTSRFGTWSIRPDPLLDGSMLIAVGGDQPFKYQGNIQHLQDQLDVMASIAESVEAFDRNVEEMLSQSRDYQAFAQALEIRKI